MRRRALITLLSGAATAWPLATLAQRMPVIGFLNSASPEGWAAYLAAFREGLSVGGYVEGSNVVITFRWAEGHYERLPGLAADLVAKRVAVIAATGGGPVIRAAMAATRTIPIVFTSGTDPVASGFVESLAHPNGNVTGVSLISNSLVPKRLELLRELVPTATTIAVLVNSANRAPAELPAIERAIRGSGLELQVIEVATESEIDRGFASFTTHRPGALLVAAEPFFEVRRDQIAALAARYAVPAIYGWREYVDAGGLISYGSSLTDGYRKAGIYTGRVLGGAQPADLPVQEPTKIELVVNLKTAKTLGLAIPQSILARADEVIE
jgi:putative ABC transport system substrate-binding protein